MKRKEENDPEKKTDRRVLKTKRAIRNAFATLLSEKDLNAITIKDISDVADINRKTVYNYYAGIHEILDEIENEIISVFERVIRNIDLGKSFENPRLIFESLNEIIDSDMEFYSRFMKIDANSHLVRKIVSSLKTKVRETLAEQLPAAEDRSGLAADFITSGMVSAYQCWFNSRNRRPLSEFSRDVGALVFYGISGLLNENGTSERKPPFAVDFSGR